MLNVNKSQKHILMFDSFCELPEHYYDNESTFVLPSNIFHSGQAPFLDTHDVNQSRALYQSSYFIKENNLNVEPLSYYHLRKNILHILRGLAIDRKEATTLHIQYSDPFLSKTLKRSVEEFYTKNSHPSSDIHKELIKLFKNNNFKIRAYDTKQAFSGQGLAALFSIEQFHNKIYLTTFREQFSAFINNTKTFIIPGSIPQNQKKSLLNKIYDNFKLNNKSDELFLIEKGHKKLFGLYKNKRESFKEIIIQVISDLSTNKSAFDKTILNYGGNIHDFMKLYEHEYKELQLFFNSIGHDLILKTSTISTGVKLGNGHICISYCPK